MIMHTLLTPEPKEAQLSCMKAVDSRDWSIILLLFACLCSVDWDVAGPFDSDAPIALDVVEIMQGHGVVLDWVSEIFGKSMKMKCQNEEQNEEEMMLAKENVKHLEMRVDEMGMI